MLTEDIVRIQIESANDSRAETGDAALDERVATATTAWCKAQTTEPAACIVARGNGVSLEDAQFALATLHGI